VAEELAVISQAGMHGIGLSFINYLNEVPYFCDEVLPRLERAGVRVKRRFALWLQSVLEKGMMQPPGEAGLIADGGNSCPKS
jgi:hypothetical protein